jgi:L-amino acid N-acyltransferase YncA
MTEPEPARCGPVELRPARPADCEAIWRWNFAPDVRARSLRNEPVPFIEHVRWFARRLTEATAPIWVVEEYREAVGVVRIDPSAYGRARISIALAELVRGRGVGRIAVAAACARWRRPIVAEIFAGNTSSTACFEACGFRAFAAEAGLVTYHWDLET